MNEPEMLTGASVAEANPDKYQSVPVPTLGERLAEAEATIRQLRAENAAYAHQVATKREAAAEVERCESAVERAKAVVAARKIDLADAHDRLVAVVTGTPKQARDPDLTPSDDHEEVDPDRNYLAPLPERTPNDPPASASGDIAGRVGAWRRMLRERRRFAEEARELVVGPLKDALILVPDEAVAPRRVAAAQLP